MKDSVYMQLCPMLMQDDIWAAFIVPLVTTSIE